MSSNNNENRGSDKGDDTTNHPPSVSALSPSRKHTTPRSSRLESPDTKPAMPNLGQVAMGDFSAAFNRGFVTPEGSAAADVVSPPLTPNLSPWPEFTHRTMMPPKISWERPMPHPYGHATQVPGYMHRSSLSPLQKHPDTTSQPATGLGVGFAQSSTSHGNTHYVDPGAAQAALYATAGAQATSLGTGYHLQPGEIPHASEMPFLEDLAIPSSSTAPLMQHPFGAPHQRADQPRTVHGNKNALQSDLTFGEGNRGQYPASGVLHDHHATHTIPAKEGEQSMFSGMAAAGRQGSLRSSRVGTVGQTEAPSLAAKSTVARDYVYTDHLITDGTPTFRQMRENQESYKSRIAADNEAYADVFPGGKIAVAQMNPETWEFPRGVSSSTFQYSGSLLIAFSLGFSVSEPR